jgi:hypothetical protein
MNFSPSPRLKFHEKEERMVELIGRDLDPPSARPCDRREQARPISFCVFDDFGIGLVRLLRGTAAAAACRFAERLRPHTSRAANLL